MGCDHSPLKFPFDVLICGVTLVFHCTAGFVDVKSFLLFTEPLSVLNIWRRLCLCSLEAFCILGPAGSICTCWRCLPKTWQALQTLRVQKSHSGVSL